MRFEEIDIESACRIFVAYDDEGPGSLPVGAISVDGDERGSWIETVVVDERHRGRGIADALLEHAREATGWDLMHDTGDRSPAGARWAARHGITGRHGEDFDRRMTAREGEACGASLMSAVFSAMLLSVAKRKQEERA